MHLTPVIPIRVRARAAERVRAYALVLSLSVVVLAGVIAGLAPAGRATAVSNSTINFQAKLEQSDGGIAADGNYNVEFKLYSASSGGTALWTEDWLNSAGHGIRVVNGYLTADLGTVTAFPSTIPWDQNLYITMNIGGTGGGSPSYDGEMSPRLRLTAVPYAFQAKSADQLQVTNGGFVTKLQLTPPTTSSITITAPNQSGTICLENDYAGCGFASAAGSTGYIQNGTSLQGNANFNIQTSATNAATAVIQALTGQTADLLTFRNAANTANLSGINSTGQLYYQSGSSQGILAQASLGQTTTYTLPDPGYASATFCLLYNGGGSNCAGAGSGITGTGTNNFVARFNSGTTITASSLLYDNGSIVGVGVTSGGGLLNVAGSSTTQSGLYVTAVSSATAASAVIQAATGQTGNLIEFQDASGTPLTVVGADGSIYTTATATIGSGTALSGTTGGLNVQAGGGSSIAQVIRAGSSQTGDLLSLQNNSGTVTSGFNGSGQLFYKSGSFLGTLAQASLGQSTTYTLPDPGYATAQFCLLYNGGGSNCAGAGSGITGSGSNNYVARFNSPSTLVNSTLLYDDGNIVGVGTTSGIGLLNVKANSTSISSLYALGSATQSVPVVVIRGGASPDPGADLLNLQADGGSTVAKFDRQGNFTTTGSASIGTGLTVVSGGAAIEGTTTINTSSGGSTSIGTSSSSFSLLSSGLKVTTAGALSGITTLQASGAITAATSGNTINGLIINGGALSGVTGYTQTGTTDFNASGSTGAFKTSTGAVSLNGNTTVTGTGSFTTGSGAVTLGSLGLGLVQSDASGLLTSGAVDRNSSSFLSGTLNVGNGGTGATSFTANGILFGNGSGAIGATAAANNAVLTTNSSGTPSLSNTLPLLVQGNITQVGALSSGSIASGFGAISTANNISTTATVSGNIINATGTGAAIQLGGTDINTAGTLSNVAYLNQANSFGNFTNTFGGSVVVQGSGGLTLGTTSTAGKLIMTDGNNHTLTFTSTSQANNINITIPADTNTNDVLCLKNLANCGTAGAVLGSGTQNYVAKFDTTGSHIANSNIYDDGTFVGINTNSVSTGLLSIVGASASQSGFFVQNATSATAPVAVIKGGVTPAAGADLLELQDSTGAVLAKFDRTGNLTAAGATISNLGAGIVSANSSGTLSSGTINRDTSPYLTGTLSVGNGGTGATTFASNGVVFGNGTGALSATTAGTSGQLLVANASGVPTFVSASGDVSLDATGATSVNKLQGNTLTITTPSTGQYLRYNGTAFVNSAIQASDISGTLFTAHASTGTDQTIAAGQTLNFLAGASNNLTVSATNTRNLTFDIVSNPTFAGTVTSSSNTTGLALTGTPAAAATSSLLQIGSAIAGGNAGTNGGTYIGLNAPATGAGSAADFINFQVNGTTKLLVTNSGALTATGTVTLSTLGTGIVTANSTGVLSSGTVDRNSSSYLTGTLTVANGGTGLSTLTANGLLYATSSSAVGQATGTSGQLLLANASGVPTFTTVSGDVSIDSAGATTVAKLQGNTLTITTPTTGQYLRYNGTAFVNSGVQASDITGTLFTVHATSGADQTVASGNTLNFLAGSSNNLTVTNSATRNLTIDIVSNPSFSGLVTASSNTTAVALTGTPAAAATSSLLQLGSTIAGGNSATNGGTYIGVNLPSTGAGSAADFLNFQANGVSKLSVTNNGSLTTTGTVTLSALGAGLVTTNASGVVSSGTINRDTSPYLTGTLSVGNGGTGLSTLTANGVLYAGSSSSISQATGTSGQVLIAGATGVPSFQTISGDISIDAAGATTVNKLQGNTLTVTTPASGQYLRYNGTAFVNSAIQASDVPSLSAYYINNSTTQQTGANFNIQAASATVAAKIQGASGQNIINFYGSASSTTPVAFIDGTGNLSAVAGTFSGSVTSGTSSAAGSFVLTNGSGQQATIQTGAITGSTTVSFPTNVGTNDTFCLVTLANCTSSTSASGSTNYIAKFTSATGLGAQTSGASLFDDGSFFGIGTTTNSGLVSIQGIAAGQSSLYVTAAANATVPVAKIVGGATPGSAADLLDFFASGGSTPLAKIDKDGNIVTTGTTTTNGFTNSGSTLNTAITLGNFATGGSIGSAGSTVDVATTINIPQTTASQTLTIPSPTTTTAGRIIYINNTGSTSFTIGSIIIPNGQGRSFEWNGSAWTQLSTTLAGTGLTQTGNTINSAAPTSVTNDTNVTGSIASNVLTLGWTGTLSVARGGTGASTLASGGLVVGNGTGAVTTVTGTANQILQTNGTTPSYVTVGGDASLSGGSLTINKLQGNTLTITTPTSGQYLRYNGSAFVNSAITASDVTGTLFTLQGSTGTAQNVTAGSTVTIAAGSSNNLTSVASSTNTITVDIVSNPSFTGAVTSTSNTTGLVASGTPSTNGTSSILQLGGAITGGNTSANGGTYFGINEPASGAGSAADFVNFQNNNASKFKIDSTGALTAAGTTTLSSLGAGIVTSNASGVLSSGALDRNSSTYFNTTLSVANGGTGATTFASNGILYGNTGSAIQATAAGTNGQFLVAGSGGTPQFASLAGDLSGSTSTAGSVTVSKLQGNTLTITTPTSGQYLRYNGSAFVNAAITASDVSGTLFTLQATSGTSQAVTAGSTVTIARGASNNLTTTAGATNTVTVDIVSNPTFTGTVTSSSNTTGLALTGAPAATANTSLLQLGGVISGGNTATNGGTYIGVNEPASGAGSAADFLNFQNNNAVKLKVDSTGALTVAGTTTLSSFTTAGLVTNNASGVLSTLSSIDLGSSTLLSGTLGVNRGGTGQTSFTSGSLLLGNGSSALSTVAAGTANQILQSNGTTPSYVTVGGDASLSGGTLTINKLQGNTLTITTPSTGQYLRYNGSAFVNSAITASDVTGTLFTLQGSTGTAQNVTAGSTVTIAAGSSNNLTSVASATNTITVDIVQNPTFTGLITGSGGATLTGTVQINATGTGTTTIGNNGAALTLANKGAASTTTLLTSRVAGDTVDRYSVSADGTQSFGAGNAAADVSLGRLTGGVLAATGKFSVVSGGSGSIALRVVGATSQSANLFQLQDVSGNIGAQFNAKANQLTLGSTAVLAGGASAAAGQLVFSDGTNTSSATAKTLTLQAPGLNNNSTVSFPATAAATDTICLLTANNCAVSNAVTGSGSNNYVARFTGTNTIGTGLLYDTGSTSNFVAVNGTAALTNASSVAGTFNVTAVGSQVGIIVKGAASQDIADFQSSAGTVVAKLDSTGALTTAGITVSSFGAGLVTSNSSGVLSSTASINRDTSSYLTGTLSVPNGGTGTTTFASNGVLYGNGNSAIQATAAAGTVGQFLVSGTGSTPQFAALSGDLTGSTSTAGSVTVSKLQGTGLSIVSATSGQYLRYNGSNWVNAAVQAGDITGTLFTLAGTSGTSQAVTSGSTVTIARGASNNLTTTAGATNTVTVDIVSNPSFSGAVTSTSNTTGLVANGAPTNNGTSSLVQLGSAIANGNTSASGGTYLGINAPAAGNGSAADFVNFQNNGTAKFTISSTGVVDAAGGLKIGGTTVFDASRNLTANAATISSFGAGLVTSNSSGVLSSTASINRDTSTYLTGTLSVGNGGTGQTSLTSGGVLYGNGTGAISNTGAGTANQILQSNGSTPSYVTLGGDASLSAGSLTVNKLQGKTLTIGATPATNDVLLYNGSAFVNQTIGGDLTPSGSTAGSFTVSKLNGVPLSFTSLTSGQYLRYNGTNWVNSGVQASDVTGTLFTLAGTSGTSQAVTAGSTVTIARGLSNNLTTTAGATNTVTIDIVSAPTFSGTVTSSNSSGPAFLSSGAPTNTASAAQLLLGDYGNFSGNTNANGGTYIGVNAPVSGAGSIADLINLQAGGASKFKVTSTGALTAAGTITFSNLTSGIVTAASGVLSAGSINRDTSTYLTGTLSVGNGGTGQTSFTTGGLLYGNGSSGLSATGAGSANQILQSNGSTPSYVTLSGDASLSGGSLTVNKLQGKTLTIGATPAGGDLLLYNGSAFVNQAVTGDVTINSSGVTAIGAGKVTNTQIATPYIKLDPSASNSNVLVAGSSSLQQINLGSTVTIATVNNPTFTGTVTASAAGQGILITPSGSLPAASATQALLQMGTNTLNSGNASGTFFGINTSSASSADFINFQNNGGVKLTVDSTGLVNARGGFSVGANAGTSLSSCTGYLNNPTFTGGILTSGSCASASTTLSLQNAYNNSGTTNPQIRLDSTSGGIKIADNATTSLGTTVALFDVLSGDLATHYFSVYTNKVTAAVPFQDSSTGTSSFAGEVDFNASAGGNAVYVPNAALTVGSGSGTTNEQFVANNTNLTQTYNALNGTGFNRNINTVNTGGVTSIVYGEQFNLQSAGNSNGTYNNVYASRINASQTTGTNFFGIDFEGTGFKDLLTYNGAQLFSGAVYNLSNVLQPNQSGRIQNVAFDPALSYSNINKVGTLISGSIASGFGTIATANNITTSALIGGGTLNAGSSTGSASQFQVDGSGNVTLLNTNNATLNIGTNNPSTIGTFYVTSTGNLQLSATSTSPVLQLSGLPNATNSTSMIQIGSALSGTSAAGGTYIGINEPASGAGSASDFVNFQNNGNVVLRVSSAGTTTLNGALTTNNKLTITGSGADITGTVKLNTLGTADNTNVLCLNTAGSLISTCNSSFQTAVTGGFIQKTPSATGNTVQPTADVVGFSVRAFTGGTSHAMDIQNTSGSVVDYFDNAGTFNVGANIQPTSGSTAGSFDLGTTTNAFRNAYVGTSLYTPAIATIAGTAPNGITIQPGANSTNSGTGASTTIAGGNETGTTSTGGSVSINGGTGTTTNGNVNIGTSNTQAVSIGINGKATSINGTLSVAQAVSVNSNTVFSNAGLLQNSAFDTTLNYSNLQKVTLLTASSGYAITGATTAGHYLRNDGTKFVDSALTASDISGTMFNLAGTSGTSQAVTSGQTVTIARGSSNNLTTSAGSGPTVTIDLVPNPVVNSLTIANTNTGNTAFAIQNASAQNALSFDTLSGQLKVYDSSVVTPVNYAYIGYANNTATFSASSGVTQIGAASGNVTVPLTGQNDHFTFTHTYTPVATYNLNDFVIQRILTGGSNTLNGNVATIEDRSTGSADAATVLYLNENNASATGYLIQAQTTASVNQLTLDTAGNLNIRTGYQVGGTAGITASCSGGQSIIAPTVIGGIVTAGSCGTGATLQNVYDNSGSPATITTTSATKGFLLQAGASLNSTALFQVKDAGGTNALLTVDSTNKNIQIGSSTTDTTQVTLSLDSMSNFADGATCNSSLGGGLYYNTNTNSIRACMNSAWEDLASTSGLGIMLFGVVPDSGTNPGDLPALGTANQSGPCKVSWASTTSIAISACTVYTNGRKVVYGGTNGTNLTTTNTVANNFQHVCFLPPTGGGSPTPVLTTSASETTFTAPAGYSFPAFSASSPTLCLADVKFTGTNNTISQIYDVRTFTNTQKEFVTLSTAAGLGQAVVPSGSNAAPATSATAVAVMGVVVATNGSTSTTTPNAIISVAGPSYAKVAASASAGNFVATTTTSGYVTTVAPGTGVFGAMGVARNTYTATCNSVSTCIGSIYFNESIR